MPSAIRAITAEDRAVIAAIHAASWRSTYRGIFRDQYLDGDLLSNRLQLWERRLSPIQPNHFGFLALSNELAQGFAFAFGAHDPVWGTQIDNLHVLPDHKGKGIGRQLLQALCQRTHIAYAEIGLYLWVYEANESARGFYERLGGKVGEQLRIQLPDGGEAAELRYFRAGRANLNTA